jgi:UDP-N-acetylmuramoyl-tripeptide--D-alanyl-D-alanine ligase
LESFQAVQGRSNFKTLQIKAFNAQLGQELEHSIALVDDSYNANPDSVLAAIDLLAHLEGPRVLVLGDMGEVGENAVMFHEEVGRYASQVGIEQLLGLGALTQHATVAFNQSKSRDQRAEHFENIEPLIEALSSRLPEFQSVLVKGSRFMKMERVVQALWSQNMAKEDITCS